MTSENYTISEYTHLPDKEVLDNLIKLADEIFGISTNDIRIPYRMGIKRPILILIAYVDKKPVGFKIGFEQTESFFYSWLGGVLPDYRKKGIASELMKKQHQWIAEQGYKFVETRTRNRYRSMLILNIRHGFSIVGTLIENNDVKIILRKRFGTDSKNSTQMIQ